MHVEDFHYAHIGLISVRARVVEDRHTQESTRISVTSHAAGLMRARQAHSISVCDVCHVSDNILPFVSWHGVRLEHALQLVEETSVMDWIAWENRCRSGDGAKCV